MCFYLPHDYDPLLLGRFQVVKHRHNHLDVRTGDGWDDVCLPSALISEKQTKPGGLWEKLSCLS